MKFRFSKLSIVLLAVFAVCLGSMALLWAAMKDGTYFYMLGVGANVLFPVLLYGGLLSLAVAVWHLVSQNFGHKIICGITVAVPTLYAAFYIFAFCVWTVGGTHGYYELKSPEGEHTVVVENHSFLQGSSLIFYEKTSFCTMKWMGSVSAEYDEKEGVMQSIEWDDDGITVTRPVLDNDPPEKERFEFSE